MTPEESLKALKALRHKDPLITDQQIADKLGIHRVSWLRIKNGRAPVSDKFLVRVNRAFPELGVFLSSNATNHSKVASPNTPETHHNKILERLVSWLEGIINRIHWDS